MGFKVIIFIFVLLYIFCLVSELEVELFGLFDIIEIIDKYIFYCCNVFEVYWVI